MVIFVFVLVGGVALSYFTVPSLTSLTYTSPTAQATVVVPGVPVVPTVTHLETPEPLKAVYMSSWVAGTPSIRTKMVKLVDETELNAIVIDIKDYTGKVSFEVKDLKLKAIGSSERRIADIEDFIRELHKKNIYVIGRVAVFQDPYMVKLHPEWAVKKESDGSIWKDYKGITWIDAGARENWDYIGLIAKEAYSVGFDEINLDYIRFPSDGNMKDIAYPFSQNGVHADVIKDFFAYITPIIKSHGLTVSGDLFGMTTTNKDDLNIGQILEDALLYFDYVAPMVYPSHYPKGFNGHSDPNKYPYEVVNYSMSEAVKRALAASTSPLKLRPWLQDFDYGGNYGTEEVRAQIKATYDAGLTSWFLWNASNVYTREALDAVSPE